MIIATPPCQGICFANTVHDENCYLIFGVADDLNVTGMQKPRRKQADIIDAISNLIFAGDVYPVVEVKTIVFDGTELDVLTIFNVENTPIYLKKQYGQMRPGCIYTRIGDKNTSDNGNADMIDIENLWRKRLGLTKPPLEYIYDRLRNKAEYKICILQLPQRVHRFLTATVQQLAHLVDGVIQINFAIIVGPSVFAGQIRSTQDHRIQQFGLA